MAASQDNPIKTFDLSAEIATGHLP
jgi:hypothetical protein